MDEFNVTLDLRSTLLLPQEIDRLTASGLEVSQFCSDVTAL